MNSVQPSEPPGCPLWQPCTMRMMSRRTWEQMRSSSSVDTLEAAAGAGFVMSGGVPVSVGEITRGPSAGSFRVDNFS